MTNEELNQLSLACWPDHDWSDFGPVLARGLAYVRAYEGERLVGYVNLAWDGGIHAFVLDTTVRPSPRRRGIGRRLVEHAVQAARERGIVWIHVDFEPHLARFYEQCGFRSTLAGLGCLADKPSPPSPAV